MTEQLVCRRDDFETHASNTFNKLWNDQDFTDVTLVTSDHEHVGGHKVILSSSSVFFKDIFLRSQQQNPLLYLKDISKIELDMILEFIYFGQCKVKHEDLGRFLATGKSLEIVGLLENKPNRNIDEDSANIKEESPQKAVIFKTQLSIIKTNTEIISKVGNKRHVGKIVENNDEIFNNKMLPTENLESSPAIEAVRSKLKIAIENKFFSNGIFSCDECTMNFKSFKKLKIHKEYIHKGLLYDCDQCDYRAIRRNVISHKMSKHEELQYPCDQCEYKAARASTIKRHMQLRHEDPTYSCDKCEYMGTSQANLNYHIKLKCERS